MSVTKPDEYSAPIVSTEAYYCVGSHISKFDVVRGRLTIQEGMIFFNPSMQYTEESEKTEFDAALK